LKELQQHTPIVEIDTIHGQAAGVGLVLYFLGSVLVLKKIRMVQVPGLVFQK
jgi:hypothetical protein